MTAPTNPDFLSFHEPTMNQYGFMLRQVDPFAHKFLDFLATNTTDLPSIDIGAAYGVVSLEAHKRGHNIIANDLSKDHLQLMQKRANEMGLHPIPTLAGDFFTLPIQPNSLYSVHISRVLHFLTGEQIIEALNLFHTWLAPGGKLFAINETPFCGTITTFLSEYEERKAQNDPWPGWIDDMDRYFNPNRRPYVAKNVHMLDEETCLKCLKYTPFKIDELAYVDRKGCFPDDSLSDGRESIGFVVTKLNL